MRYHRYSVLLEPDVEEPHRYNVRVPALPGCRTYGESVDDALANAAEAITGFVAVLVDSGEPVPIEHHPTLVATVAVPVAHAVLADDRVVAMVGASEEPL